MISLSVVATLVLILVVAVPFIEGLADIPLLYTHPKTRSALIAWYLNELKVPFDEQVVALESKEHKTPSFLDLNPFGQLPVLQTPDGNTVFESGAILLFLAETYGELKGRTAYEKANVAKWILFANSSLATKVMQGAGRNGSPGWRITMTPILNVLETELGKSDSGFLMGTGDITAADVAVASLLLYTPVFHKGEYTLLKDFKNVVNYMERMASRPAYLRAYGAERVAIVNDGIEGYRNPSKPKRKEAGWSLF